MKLFLIFIPLILIYSKDIKTIDNEPLIKKEYLSNPLKYSNMVRFRFKRMWNSCNKTSINYECKLNINSFIQIVLNSTNDYSSHANNVYSLINLNRYKFSNDNMRIKYTLVAVIKYILNIDQRISHGTRAFTRGESDTIGNAGCRFFVWLFGYKLNLCD